jgi:hypothetical protein
VSTTFPAELRCPKCATPFAVELFTNLHVTRAPERREAVLQGKFSIFPCPSCDGRIRLEPTMLYTDFERWRWYGVFPRSAIRHRTALVELVRKGFHENLEVAAPPMVREWAPKFAVRVVFGLASLRDKLLCEDHGLDDRALEVLKWMVLRESAPGAIQPDSEVHLEEVRPDQLVIRIEPPPGADGTVVARLLGVDRARLAEAAPLIEKIGMGGDVVDWRAPLCPDEPLADPVGEPRVRTPWMNP